MGSIPLDSGFHAKYFLNCWSMIFHSVKISLKRFTILCECLSTHCDLKYKLAAEWDSIVIFYENSTSAYFYSRYYLGNHQRKIFLDFVPIFLSKNLMKELQEWVRTHQLQAVSSFLSHKILLKGMLLKLLGNLCNRLMKTHLHLSEKPCYEGKALSAYMIQVKKATSLIVRSE